MQIFSRKPLCDSRQATIRPYPNSWCRLKRGCESTMNLMQWNKAWAEFRLWVRSALKNLYFWKSFWLKIESLEKGSKRYLWSLAGPCTQRLQCRSGTQTCLGRASSLLPTARGNYEATTKAPFVAQAGLDRSHLGGLCTSIPELECPTFHSQQWRVFCSSKRRRREERLTTDKFKSKRGNNRWKISLYAGVEPTVISVHERNHP